MKQCVLCGENDGYLAFDHDNYGNPVHYHLECYEVEQHPEFDD